MAYNSKSLNRIGSMGYAAGDSKSVFAYATDDTVAGVVASGYFNDATARLKKGDLLLISGTVSGTPTCRTAVVTSATGAATVTTAVAT
jgi:hypothetical protein